MTRADKILRQDERPIFRIPDGERPITDQLGESVWFPSVRYAAATISRSVDSDDTFADQLADEFFAVVEPSVPGEDEPRWRNMRLDFAA